MSETDARVPRRLSFIWKRCGNCVLIVTPGGERVLLNPDAGRVWEYIDDRRTVAAIKEQLAVGGPGAVNVDEVLDNMVRAGVVTYDSYLWAQEP